MITLKQAQQSAQKQVDRNPDFVYVSHFKDVGGAACLYVYEGTPDCIIGRMLNEDFGYSLEDLEKFNETGSVETLIAERLINVEAEARIFMSELQAYQDNGTEWKRALLKATETVTPVPSA